MTKLLKDDFCLGYGSERYVTYGPKRTFIARFKYGSAAACANHHVKDMIKLISAEELDYILETSADSHVSTMRINKMLDERGHIHYNIVKAAKIYGVTPQYLKAHPGHGYSLALAA